MNFNFSKHLSQSLPIYLLMMLFHAHIELMLLYSKVTQFLPSFAGLQLETEINALKKVTSEIKKPVTCIIGGSKISTKIGIIKNLIPKFDNIIIVGGMANNILNYMGNPIGKSIREDNCEKIIDDIFKTAKIHSCSIIYPEDVIVGKNMDR